MSLSGGPTGASALRGPDPHRGGQLTDVLLAPPTSLVSAADRDAARDRIVTALVGSVGGRPEGPERTVGLPVLIQRARDQPVPTDPEESFTWKPAFVRRSLGLATVEACLERRFRWPAEAVGPVADRAVAEWQRTGWRTFHWEPWFAALSAGARAAVLAEASAWATTLWSALAWRRFPVPPRLGGSDDQWVCPSDRTVRLRGRCEVRIPLVGQAAAGHAPPVVGTALVSLMSGHPPAAGGEPELAFLALVSALASPTRPVPSRVAGLWLHAGEHRVVEVTGELLVEAASRVVGAAASLADEGSGDAVGPA